jgi:hypothetical protein
MEANTPAIAAAESGWIKGLRLTPDSQRRTRAPIAALNAIRIRLVGSNAPKMTPSDAAPTLWVLILAIFGAPSERPKAQSARSPFENIVAPARNTTGVAKRNAGRRSDPRRSGAPTGDDLTKLKRGFTKVMCRRRR